MRRRIARASLLAALAALVAVLTTPWSHARAQYEGLGGSYITPFPENDTYQVLVIGDWLTSGLTDALVEGFANDSRVRIARKPHSVPTLFRGELDEDLRELDQSLAREKAHVAIVLLGTGDRVSVRLPGQSKRAQVGSDAWKSEYGRRIDRIMRLLKARGAAVYWIGLPVLRRADANEDAQMMNELYRARALSNGMRYVDIFAGFAEEGGDFAAYGPDLTGKSRRLRDPDGVGFTGAGYRKLAHFVESEVKRDLGQARAERIIPLAGSEGEQARVNPAKIAAAAAAQAAASARAAQANAAAGASSGRRIGLAGNPRTSRTGDQKADNGKITLRTTTASGRQDNVTLDILRPAIPAAVISIIARRQGPEKGAAQQGEAVMTRVAGGLTLLSVISDATEPTGRRRLSPTQAPYFRVLVKGEPQPAKPGRADDFRWPRPKPPAETSALRPPDGSAGDPTADRVDLPVRPRTTR